MASVSRDRDPFQILYSVLRRFNITSYTNLLLIHYYHYLLYGLTTTRQMQNAGTFCSCAFNEEVGYEPPEFFAFVSTLFLVEEFYATTVTIAYVHTQSKSSKPPLRTRSCVWSFSTVLVRPRLCLCASKKREAFMSISEGQKRERERERNAKYFRKSINRATNRRSGSVGCIA